MTSQEKWRVVFMGSPAEVICCLEELQRLERTGSLELVAVVSQPARPVGRKLLITNPPVADFALKQGLALVQPVDAREPSFIDQLRKLRPDIVITAAYGQILSKDFLQVPKRATINIHPSLLPRWRGATPVPSTLFHGDLKSGVSILFTVQKLDAGPLIWAEEYHHRSDECAGELTQHLFELGAKGLSVALTRLRDPSFSGELQDETQVLFCHKFSKEDGRLDWAKGADEIYRKFKALFPWPGCFTFLGAKRILINAMRWDEDGDASTSNEQSSKLYGTLRFDENLKSLVVQCGRGEVHILQLTPEGGRMMDAKSYWNGLKAHSHPRWGTP